MSESVTASYLRMYQSSLCASREVVPHQLFGFPEIMFGLGTSALISFTFSLFQGIGSWLLLCFIVQALLLFFSFVG